MLCIQDDCFNGSLHLDEVLLSSVFSATAGGAAFAFASSDGLNAIFGSREFSDYYKHHRFTLVVGLDAVTNTKSLAKAKELVAASRGALDVRVYMTDSPRNIFHPKFAWFKDQTQGGSVSVVGSGNLTLRGLQDNVEAFVWDALDDSEIQQTIRTWDDWLASAEAAGRLFELDDEEVQKRAALNTGGRGGARNSSQDRNNVQNGGDVLICGIAKQTGRGWTQVNVKKSYFENYFGFSATDSSANVEKRILLQQVTPNGTLGAAESRRGVISSTSSNYRIEVDGGKDIPENASGIPMIAFIKTGDRTFLYEIFLDGDPHYEDVLRFADAHSENRPRNELPKCLITLDVARNGLSSIPLLQTSEIEVTDV